MNLKIILILPSFIFLLITNASSQTQYVCAPCGDCDTVIYDAPGTCTACGMELIDRSLVKHSNITIPDVCGIVQANKDVVILDVRTKEEFEGTHKTRPNEGRLKGAVNINIDELEARLNEISQYKENEIIVYCSHAHRSQRASHLLTQKGFTNVKNMLGGISRWEDYDSICKNDLLIKENK
jgi:rhodanese-related sulfurtransferase